MTLDITDLLEMALNGQDGEFRIDLELGIGECDDSEQDIVDYDDPCEGCDLCEHDPSVPSGRVCSRQPDPETESTIPSNGFRTGRTDHSLPGTVRVINRRYHVRKQRLSETLQREGRVSHCPYGLRFQEAPRVGGHIPDHRYHGQEDHSRIHQPEAPEDQHHSDEPGLHKEDNNQPAHPPVQQGRGDPVCNGQPGQVYPEVDEHGRSSA